MPFISQPVPLVYIVRLSWHFSFLGDRFSFLKNLVPTFTEKSIFAELKFSNSRTFENEKAPKSLA